MGSSVTTGVTFDKIKNAFTGRRDRFQWISTECLPQVELECGFRVVEAVRVMCQELMEGRNVQDCIRRASMIETRLEEYCSIDVRKGVSDTIIEAEREACNNF